MHKLYSSTPRTAFALIGVAVAFLIGGALLVKHAVRDRVVIVSSPSPPSVFVDGRIPLAPGDEACLAPIGFTPAAGRIRLVAETRADPVPPLRITARAADTVKSTIVRDYRSDEVTAILVPFTVKENTGGSVCVRNVGSSRVALASTDEARYASLTKTQVNGRPTKMQASLHLVTRNKESIADRVSIAVRHDAQLTGVLPRAVVWLLLVVVLVALIAGPLYAMIGALRQDDESSD